MKGIAKIENKIGLPGECKANLTPSKKFRDNFWYISSDIRK
ncbi:hypothetical protein KB13_496 [beta proteobacterium KB13]|uniref:Uncharacterized protein n=1 Tax=beta proteobacterium KB13 TaxID=314607 RepID=B6BTI8_9PROT|nr:hypothetical protein KB13_496 [beta proteobacterium KB13]